MPRARSVPIITLTTDIGVAYAAQIKGVLCQEIAPGQIVDVTHDIGPQGIPEAAFLLREIGGQFPAGTIHLVVVDPGVGSRRAPIAIECRGGTKLVGPDNGVLLPLADRLGRGRVVRIDAKRFERARRVGSTFDGRDLFAPVAARLANGTDIGELGPRWAPIEHRLPEPRLQPFEAEACVLYVDRFGNLITNVSTSWIPEGMTFVQIASDGQNARRLRWVTHYDELGAGEIGALGSSFGLLEVAMGRGDAASRLELRAGDPVRFRLGRPLRRAQDGK